MRWTALIRPAGVVCALSTMAHAEPDTWWAEQPLVRPAVPTVQADQWCANPIDNFILAGLEAAGMDPAPQADRATLIRRAT